MPIQQSWLNDRQILHSRLIGTVTNQELLNYYRKILSTGIFLATKRELVDATESQQILVDLYGRQQLVELVAESNEGATAMNNLRVGMLACSELSFGLFRQWQLYSEDLNYEIRVFRERRAAMDWLAQTPDPGPS